ncbi:hypothetical protein E2C01_062147 [Portunus trituberculatus]|uniref:Uncharacterized protein n=1 Tax=Portunus trituberculatus TaxID=210409 RepID=A0A5B7HDR8_PORTR|nr:hypothetical protein [Portunus trituberculatus]
MFSSYVRRSDCTAISGKLEKLEIESAEALWCQDNSSPAVLRESLHSGAMKVPNCEKPWLVVLLTKVSHSSRCCSVVPPSVEHKPQHSARNAKAHTAILEQSSMILRPVLSWHV